MSEKWGFDKLQEAVHAHEQAHRNKWDEKTFEEKQKADRQAWYISRSDAYQEGFEAVLAKAGWTRLDYCDEYDIRIGWDITAGHPAHFMSPSQRVAWGLKRFVAEDKNCEIITEEKRIIVRGPSYAPRYTFMDHFPPSQMLEMERFGWKWSTEAMGFVIGTG